MKKILFLAFILLAAVSCKKDSDSDDSTEPTVDARDAFVGEYELTLDGTLSLSTTNETISSMLPDNVNISDYIKEQSLIITKDSTKDNQVILSGFYNCKALVSGNNMILESSTESRNISIGDIIGLDLGGDIPVSYTFVHKTATLTDGVLTWHTDANGSASISVTIVIPIDFTLTGVASIENTAIKL